LLALIPGYVQNVTACATLQSLQSMTWIDTISQDRITLNVMPVDAEDGEE